MSGMRSRKQIDQEYGIWETDKKCPKCGADIKHFDDGDQGGVPFDYCENDDCNYEGR